MVTIRVGDIERQVNVDICALTLACNEAFRAIESKMSRKNHTWPADTLDRLRPLRDAANEIEEKIRRRMMGDSI